MKLAEFCELCEQVQKMHPELCEQVQKMHPEMNEDEITAAVFGATMLATSMGNTKMVGAIIRQAGEELTRLREQELAEYCRNNPLYEHEALKNKWAKLTSEKARNSFTAFVEQFHASVSGKVTVPEMEQEVLLKEGKIPKNLFQHPGVAWWVSESKP